MAASSAWTLLVRLGAGVEDVVEEALGELERPDGLEESAFEASLVGVGVVSAFNNRFPGICFGLLQFFAVAF